MTKTLERLPTLPRPFAERCIICQTRLVQTYPFAGADGTRWVCERDAPHVGLRVVETPA